MVIIVILLKMGDIINDYNDNFTKDGDDHYHVSLVITIFSKIIIITIFTKNDHNSLITQYLMIIINHL